MSLACTYVSTPVDTVASVATCASDTDACSTPGRPSTPMSLNRDALYDAEEQGALAKLSQAVASSLQRIAGLQSEVPPLATLCCAHVGATGKLHEIQRHR